MTSELRKCECRSTHICVVGEITCPRSALARAGARKWLYVAKCQSKRSKPRTTAEPKVFENTDQPTLEGQIFPWQIKSMRCTSMTLLWLTSAAVFSGRTGWADTIIRPRSSEIGTWSRLSGRKIDFCVVFDPRISQFRVVDTGLAEIWSLAEQNTRISVDAGGCMGCRTTSNDAKLDFSATLG